ncbi:MAG: hypothetical protein ABFD50_17405 [Smithella sp.]
MSDNFFRSFEWKLGQPPSQLIGEETYQALLNDNLPSMIVITKTGKILKSDDKYISFGICDDGVEVTSSDIAAYAYLNAI